MTTKINTESVLSFFSGKKLEAAKPALDTLVACVEAGQWQPGVSRKVKAALSKCNEAEKVVRKVEKVQGGRISWNSPVENRARAMVYGQLHFALHDCAAIDAKDRKRFVEDELTSPWELTEGEKQIAEVYRRWEAAFRPVAQAILDLDNTRPKPVFTTMNASPTVSKTLFDLDTEKVEVCPIEYREVREVDEKGVVKIRFVGFLKWPEGTKHGTSRFAFGKGRFLQCEACGHGIRNPFNWVPLVVTSKDTTPRSFWVGCDCARTLFGVDMKGDLELAEGQR